MGTIHISLGKYFNPRSHKGSDIERYREASVVFISIHAPTRGATHYIGQIVLDPRISIHAPTRGATSGVSQIY